MFHVFRNDRRQSNVQAARPVVPRRYPLVFQHGTAAADVQHVLRTWNEYFRDEFDGVGYFAATPVTEELDGEMMDYYYLHSDLAFHNDFMSRHISVAPYIEAIVMSGDTGIETTRVRDVHHVEFIPMEAGLAT